MQRKCKFLRTMRQKDGNIMRQENGSSCHETLEKYGHNHLKYGHNHLRYGHDHLKYGPNHLKYGHNHLRYGHDHLKYGHNHLKTTTVDTTNDVRQKKRLT